MRLDPFTEALLLSQAGIEHFRCGGDTSWLSGQQLLDTLYPSKQLCLCAYQAAKVTRHGCYDSIGTTLFQCHVLDAISRIQPLIVYYHFGRS